MTLAAKVARLAKPKPDKGPLEYEIHVRVVAELHRRHAPGVQWWHTPNEGRRSAKYASGLQLMGVSPGVPDLTLVRAATAQCKICHWTGTPAEAVAGGGCRCRGTCRGGGQVEIPHSRSAALELKRKGEKPRPAQVAWLEHMAAAGWLTGWADSVERAVELLEGWGMIR